MELMGYRNITVKDQTYEKLAAAKQRQESFDALLDRLVSKEKPKASLKDLYGAWADMTAAEEKAISDSIKSAWSGWNERIGQRPSHRKPTKKS